MKVNTSMTLYHKDRKNNVWEKVIITNVMWQGGKNASINKGYDKADDITVYVPKNQNDLSNLKIDIGDIIVKGSVNIEIKVQQDLKDYKDVYNITKIIDNEYGTTAMKHIEIGAK